VQLHYVSLTYWSIIGLIRTNSLTVITIIKLKEICLVLFLALLVLISVITVSNRILRWILYLQTLVTSVYASNYSVATSNDYHPPLNLDFKLTLDCQPTCLNPQSIYSQVDYLLLYNTSNYD
jgi:hypothetical protein